MEGVSAEGRPVKTNFMAKFDGKEYPVSNSTVFAGRPVITYTDTTMLRRISSHALEGTGKKLGKIVSISRITISHDGRTLTFDARRTMPDGKTLRNISVYERQ
jgi:hypothetical protein